MPTYLHPGVYVTEIGGGVRTIEGVPTSTANLLGPDCLARLRTAIRRLPPDWTDGNSADPGIAILELMAWVSETVLFRAGKIPDRAVRPLSIMAALSLQSLEGCRLPRGSALTKVEVFGKRARQRDRSKATASDDGGGKAVRVKHARRNASSAA